jgi:hypothetical protein
MKRNILKTTTSRLDGGRKKTKIDFQSEFGYNSRTAPSHETSKSQNSW